MHGRGGEKIDSLTRKEGGGFGKRVEFESSSRGKGKKGKRGRSQSGGKGGAKAQQGRERRVFCACRTRGKRGKREEANHSSNFLKGGGKELRKKWVS